MGLVVIAEKLRERLAMADAIVDMLQDCGCASLLQRDRVHERVISQMCKDV